MKPQSPQYSDQPTAPYPSTSNHQRTVPPAHSFLGPMLAELLQLYTMARAVANMPDQTEYTTSGLRVSCPFGCKQIFVPLGQPAQHIECEPNCHRSFARRIAASARF